MTKYIRMRRGSGLRQKDGGLGGERNGGRVRLLSVGGAPEVAGGEGAVGGPAAADEFEFFGVGELAFTVGDLVAAADSEVVDGEDVGTAEVENEEHFDGPAADAFDAGEAFDEGGVVEMVAFGEGGDDAGEGFVGEVVEVGGFRAGESGGAEGGEVGARDVVGRGELAG